MLLNGQNHCENFFLSFQGKKSIFRFFPPAGIYKNNKKTTKKQKKLKKLKKLKKT
jgi:hypothetical protein